MLSITDGHAHRRQPERQAEYRPHMLFELAGLGTLDRPMTAVVHPGSDLVRHQPPADLKHSIASTPT